MKQTKRTKAFTGILFNAVMGFVLASLLGVYPAMGAVVTVGASMLCGSFMPSGAAMDGVLTEVWTGS